MLPFAQIDPEFAKEPAHAAACANGTCIPTGRSRPTNSPFRDVNPPVHAWACWRVYKMTGPRGQRDRAFLARAFQKLLINFTWWVNRKDLDGQQSLRRRLSRARQHRRLRPLQAAADGERARAGRRHRLDGLLLLDHALDGPGTGGRRLPNTKTSPPSSSSTSWRSPTR